MAYKPSFPILIFLSFATCLAAQDVHVYYNVFRDSTYYLQNGKPVSVPKVRDGKNIVLHIENYNNYLYDVAIEIENDQIELANSTTGDGLNGLLPAGGAGKTPFDLIFKGGGMDMLGGFKFFPNLSGRDLKEGSGFGTTPEEAAKQEQIAALKKVEAEFETARERVLAMDEELETMETQAQAKLVANRLQIFAAEEIAHIRYNPHLEPSQIKKLTDEYMKRVFQEEDPNKLDLSQVLKIADAQNEIPRYISEYARKVETYSKETASCELLVKALDKFSFPNSNLVIFSAKASEFLRAVNAKKQAYQANVAMLNEKLAGVQSLDPKALLALRTTYLELSNNKFSKTYTHTAKGEKMKFKLKLTPNDSLQARGLKPKSTPIEINVYGGLRVKASVGLNFGQFFNRPQQYYVRDSVLQSSDRDAFSPILTSFVHFYAPSGRMLSLAGSFGVGFPIGGGSGDNLQSISFFLGPSLVFGKNERIVISTGLMGGKTERLSQGYKTGDRFYSDSNDAPVSSVYELGYFVGVSFNLTGN